MSVSLTRSLGLLLTAALLFSCGQSPMSTAQETSSAITPNAAESHPMKAAWGLPPSAQFDPSYSSKAGGGHSVMEPGDTLITLGKNSSIFRLDTAGNILASGPAGGDEDVSHDLARQPDGKLVVTGATYSRRSTTYWVARYNTDLTLDSTFGNVGKVYFPSLYSLNDVTIQNDGKIVLAVSGKTNDKDLLRLNANGSVDTSFGSRGYVNMPLSWVTAVIVQNDGKIVAGGAGEYAIQRFLPSGKPDPTFTSLSGKPPIPTEPGRPGSGAIRIKELGLLPNGKIVGLGYDVGSYPLLTRLNSDGTEDIHNMATSLGSSDLFTMDIRGNEDIVVSGETLFTDLAVHPYVARFRNDSFDSEFGYVLARSRVLDLASDSTGRIYATMETQTARIVP